jgi:GATA-binding protein
VLPSPELIKKEARKSASAESSTQFAVPQSVPVPHHNPQTYVSKTSIDERRVSYYLFGCYL